MSEPIAHEIVALATILLLPDHGESRSFDQMPRGPRGVNLTP